MESLDCVICGYVVEDKSKERFFDFVTVLDPQIKKFDDYFEELGYRYGDGKIVVIHGEETGDIDFAEKTIVGIKIDSNSYCNEKEIRAELSCFEKLLSENEKNLVMFWQRILLDEFSEPETDKLDADNFVYKTVERIIKHINKNYYGQLEIDGAKWFVDMEEEIQYSFRLIGDKNYQEKLFERLRILFNLLDYEFDYSRLASLTNETNSCIIVFEVKKPTEKNYSWSDVK